MKKFLEKIFARDAEVKAQAGDEFAGLVAEIADGSEPNPDRVLAVLRDAGKSADDLAAAVELRTKRLEWSKLVAAKELAEAEIATCDTEIAKLDAEIEDTLSKLRERQRPLRAKREAAITKIHEGMDAERQLRMTCPNEKLRESIAAITGELGELSKQSGKLRHAIADNRSRVSTYGDQARRERGVANAAELSEVYAKRVETGKAELARIEAEKRILEESLRSEERKLFLV